MPGLIGKKLGMTSLYDHNQKYVPCTLIEVAPNVVTQVKSKETDGYEALQLGAGQRKAKNTSRALQGHLAKAGLGTDNLPHSLVEFDFDPADYKPGDTINVELFEEGEFVDVVGITKGKGFQGVVKRHGFSGVGGATHGQHNRQRAPGAIGACSFPSRVFKNMRMGGRMGNKRVKIQNLRVLKTVPEKNLLVVSGSVPGAKGSYVFVEL